MLRLKKPWYTYLWIASVIYLMLGFVNILFAWLGLICFTIPLFISFRFGSKAYCNHYCGRGQFLELLGETYGLSRKRVPPKFLAKKWFRYGFLTFFMLMFLNMLYVTYLVFAGQELNEVVTLLWTFKVPWAWGVTHIVAPGIAQFAFGFYSVMLTSTILGLLTMFIYRPRTWCVYCPMGTMTQMICKRK